jgi:heme-degrading monooxygenase HmoA
MLAAGLAPAAVAQTGPRIELYVDLAVDPAREKEMLQNFRTQFRPTAQKQPGFIDVKVVKLRSAIQGAAPAGVNYRFMISFQTEEQRQKWVATEAHQKVWPLIENTLKTKNYTVLLFDVS